MVDKEAIEKEVAKLRQANGVIWAKLSSFPMWPSRFCSDPEAAELLEQVKPTAKTKQVPVVFIGTAKTRAWVNINTISPFTNSSMSSEKFNEKKFMKNNEKDYRHGVREAIRIASGKGEIFDESVIEMCKGWDQKEEKFILDPSNICEVCKGGKCAGPLLHCAQCNCENTPNSSTTEVSAPEGKSRHFHCLDPPHTYKDKQWYCSHCAREKGLVEGKLHPRPGAKVKIVKPQPADAADQFKEASSDEESQSIKGKGRGSNKDKYKDKGKSKSKSKADEKKSQSHKKRNRSPSDSRSRSPSSDQDNRSKGRKDKEKEKGRRGRPPASGGQGRRGRNSVPVLPTGARGADMYAGSRNKASSRKRDTHDSSDDSDSDEDDGGFNPDVDTMDFCLVCGDGGTLVLCDFPQCNRAYHQACIAPTFPAAIDETPTGIDALEDPWFCPAHSCTLCGVLQTTKSDLSYVQLPSHYYHGLTASGKSCPIDREYGSLSGPVGVPRVPQAALEVCDGCPFSACSRCEEDILAAASVGVSKKTSRGKSNADKEKDKDKEEEESNNAPKLFTTTTSVVVPPYLVAGSLFKEDYSRKAGENSRLHYLPDNAPAADVRGARGKDKKFCYCQNCATPSTKMQLARVLEMAWSRMAGSKGALPFLAPFLPVGSSPVAGIDVETDTGTGIGGKAGDTSNTNKTNTLALNILGGGDPISLVKVVGAVRAGKYLCAGDFVADLRGIREQVEQVKVSDGPEEEGQVDADMSVDHQNVFEKENKLLTVMQRTTLLSAFDTAFKLCEAVLAEKKNYITKLESSLLGSCGIGNNVGSRLGQVAEVEQGERDQAPLAKKTKNEPEEDKEKDIAVSQSSSLPSPAPSPSNSQNQLLTQSSIPLSQMSQTSNHMSQTQTWDVQGSSWWSQGTANATPTIAAGAGATTGGGVDGKDSNTAFATGMWREECGRLLPSHQELWDVYPARKTMEDWADTIASHRGVRKRGLGDHGMGASGILKTLAKIVREEAVASGATGSRVLDSEIFTGNGHMSVEGHTKGNSSSSSSSSAAAGGVGAGVGQEEVETEEAEDGLFQFGQVFKEYDFRLFDAARAITGLRGSQRGETVSLLEDDGVNTSIAHVKPGSGGQQGKGELKSLGEWGRAAVSNASKNRALGNTPWADKDGRGEYVANDETLVTLDRLKDMTHRTLHLEARLRREYVKTKSFVRETGIEHVTIGDMPVIREMKMANDDLKWRLQQKHKALMMSQATVEALQKQLAEAQGNK